MGSVGGRLGLAVGLDRVSALASARLTRLGADIVPFIFGVSTIDLVSDSVIYETVAGPLVGKSELVNAPDRQPTRSAHRRGFSRNYFARV